MGLNLKKLSGPSFLLIAQTMASMIDDNVGDFNEEGLINSFTRKGYTHPRGLLELLANTLDSFDKVQSPTNFTKMILFDVSRDNIDLIENAAGMDRENVRNMFSMQRSNHAGDQSRGVSGIGGKAALFILSEQTEVHIFTRKINGPFLHIIVPWDKIVSEKVYVGKVKSIEMTSAEKDAFIKERGDYGMLNRGEAHGTTIRFKNKEKLAELIDSTFAAIGAGHDLTNPYDRASVVFGREQVDFLYKNYSTPAPPTRLEQYNYFDADNSQFYAGKSEHQVTQWYSLKECKDRFILNDYKGKDYEIQRVGRGYGRDPEEVTKNFTGYHKVGSYNIPCGMRIDQTVFNPDTPVPISGKFTPGNFNTKHLGSDCDEALWNMNLVRNNQVIAGIPNPFMALSSMRANGDSQIAGLVQAEIQFNPISNQDNHQDRVTGIQENKNQFDGKSFPIPLARIAGFLRNEKAKEVKKYMKECIDAKYSPSEDELKADRKAEAEAERLAKEKADAARLAKEKEQVDRLEVARKAEVDRLEAKLKAEADRPAPPPPHDDNDSESDKSTGCESDGSEEEYITGEDLIASLHEFYDTITVDQKITKENFKKFFDDMRLSLFAE